VTVELRGAGGRLTWWLAGCRTTALFPSRMMAKTVNKGVMYRQFGGEGKRGRAPSVSRRRSWVEGPAWPDYNRPLPGPRALGSAQGRLQLVEHATENRSGRWFDSARGTILKSNAKPTLRIR